MQLKHPEIEIPKENPFTNDILEREKCSKTLTGLVENLPGPFVLSINGGWGTGKTTFLKMWKQQLKNEGFTEIYFSAWEDDYCNDALVALIGQIWKHLEGSSLKEIVNSIKECAAPIFRTGVFNAVKTMTAGVVELNEDQLKSRSEKIVDDYIESGKNLKELKKRLGQLAQEVSKEGKPLVIIIDELDRCRPLFAIELLEKIKHLFDIPGIIFVLGLDREQLGHSIKSVYGANMNVDGYLQRFIDLDFVLSVGSSRVFTDHLVVRFGLGKLLGDDLSDFRQIHSALVSLFSLSLRDQEQCFRVLVTAASSANKKERGVNPYLLSLLSVFKIADPSIYIMVSKGLYDSSGDIINTLLKINGGSEVLNSHSGRMLEAYLIVMDYKDDWKSRKQSEANHRLIIKQAVPDRLVQYFPDQADELFNIVDRFMGFYRGYAPRYVFNLSDCIELASLMVRRDE